MNQCRGVPICFELMHTELSGIKLPNWIPGSRVAFTYSITHDLPCSKTRFEPAVEAVLDMQISCCCILQ